MHRQPSEYIVFTTTPAIKVSSATYVYMLYPFTSLYFTRVQPQRTLYNNAVTVPQFKDCLEKQVSTHNVGT